MQIKHSAFYRGAAAVCSVLVTLGQPAAVLATVEGLTLVNVPPDTKVTVVGDERSNRVEARTKESGGDGQLVFQLKERNWPSGKYVLNIWEPAGDPIVELIALADGANQIDLKTILGEPPAALPDQGGTAGSTPNPAAAGALAGAVGPSVVIGGGRRSGDDRREEFDDRGGRGGGRGSAAGIAVGGALLGALASSLFGGSSSPPPPAPAAAAPASPPAAPQPTPEFVADRVLATLAAADPAAVQATAQAVAADHNLTLLAVNALDSVNLALAEYVITDGLDPLAKSAELAADARVESAQPEFIYRTTSKQERLYYAPRLIRADNVPADVTGKGIRVALIDTGVDLARAELKNKIVESADFTGKGFSADVHGTMLAGIIAADRGSGIGVAPSVGLLAIKSCQAQRPQRLEGICWSSTLIRGIDFANTKMARVVNLSVGGPQDRLLTRLVNEAVKRNIVVVAAAGNDGSKGKPSYPAALENVIAVTAVDTERQLYRQATQGQFIDLAAPGVEIVSFGPGTRFPISSGTSFATAHVTAAIALLLEQKSDLTPPELQTALERAAQDLGVPGKDAEYGSGLVDICQSIRHLNQPKTCP